MSIDKTILCKINQRERQVLVHSYIYYDLDDNIISDSKWSEWAVELSELIKSYPTEFSQSDYAEWFDSDFDGSTGCDLNYRQPWIYEVATRLLNYRDKKHKQNKRTETYSEQMSLF